MKLIDDGSTFFWCFCPRTSRTGMMVKMIFAIIGCADIAPMYDDLNGKKIVSLTPKKKHSVNFPYKNLSCHKLLTNSHRFPINCPDFLGKIHGKIPKKSPIFAAELCRAIISKCCRSVASGGNSNGSTWGEAAILGRLF